MLMTVLQCNQKAEVIGEAKDGKFVVSYFKLLPNSTKSNQDISRAVIEKIMVFVFYSRETL